MMKNLLPRTTFTCESASARCKTKWWGTLLIVFAIYFASQIFESILLVPPIVLFVFSNMDTLAPSFKEGKLSISGEVMSILPTWLLILMLFLTVITIIACVLYCTKSEKRSLRSMGFKREVFWSEYMTGFAIGIILFTLAWFICTMTGASTFSIENLTPKIILFIALFFIGYLIQGMSEEVLCRGFMMQSMAASYPAIVAVLSNSIVFALMHLGNSGISPLAILNLTLFGAFASIYMWKRGNIWGVAAMHSAWNFVQGNVLGVSVSGMSLTPSFIRTDLLEGMKWMNGGSFGMEGGLAVTIVLTIAICLALFVMPVNKNIVIPSSEIC